MRNFVRGEAGDQIGDAVSRGIAADQRIDLVAVIAALLDRIVARIVGALGPLDRRADFGPERIGQARHHDRAVRRGKDAVGHEVGVLRPGPHRVRAGEVRKLRVVAEQPDQPIHQADIDQPSAPCSVAFVQRRQDRDRAIDPAHQITERNAQLGRHVARLAIHAERTRHRLQHDVEARPVAQRSGHPETRNRAVDQPGIDCRKRVPAQPQPVHHAGAIILDHHVGLGRQVLDQRDPLGGLEIDHHALLGAVDCQEIVALAIADRRKPSRFVAGRRLDLDHFRAEVGQRQRRCRPCQHARKIEHAHARERTGPGLRVSHRTGLWCKLPMLKRADRASPRRRVLARAGARAKPGIG